MPRRDEPSAQSSVGLSDEDLVARSSGEWCFATRCYPRRVIEAPLRAFLSRIALLATLVVLLAHQPAPPGAGAPNLFVSNAGGDGDPGTRTEPLRTLQRALDLAEPGATIVLAPGTYDGAETRRSGTAAAPITIRGPETGRDAASRFRAVVHGSRIVLQINHGHYRLEGFTVDGQPGIPLQAYPDRLSQARAFKDAVQDRVANSKLIYVGYASTSRDITGVVLENLFLHGAGGECVRLRNNAYGNVVSNCVVQWCGLAPSGDDVARYRYHNGEGVYIGTSPKSVSQPMHADDPSHDNVVRDSVVRTFGSECFQVKENAHHNVMLRVQCSDNDEPLAFAGSNVELRGGHNTVQDSVITGSRGVNLKIASDSAGYDRGGNAIVGNRFADAAGAHVSFKSARPPGLVCGNTFASSRVFAGATLPGLTAPCADSRRH